MCSGLQGHKTPRYLLKYLFHRFRCRRHFLFQKDFPRFIQNTVERPAISQIQTDRELVSFENHVSLCPNSASLFHSRSPFLVRFERVDHWERIASRWRPAFSSHLISSIKGEVKKKHLSFGWNFSCFSAPLIERDLCCPSAPCARLQGHATPRLGFSLLAVFIASWRRSLSVPKPTKQNVVQCGDHSSIRDSWPIAFSGYPRGPRVGCETVCPRHTAPNLSAETRSRTRVSREPHGHRQRNPQGWSGLDPKHSSCLWFQTLGVEARSSLPHYQHNGGNFPGQGQAGHLRPHALGQ